LSFPAARAAGREGNPDFFPLSGPSQSLVPPSRRFAPPGMTRRSACSPRAIQKSASTSISEATCVVIPGGPRSGPGRETRLSCFSQSHSKVWFPFPAFHAAGDDTEVSLFARANETAASTSISQATHVVIPGGPRSGPGREPRLSCLYRSHPKSGSPSRRCALPGMTRGLSEMTP
jgi:hypothetical protein